MAECALILLETSALYKSFTYLLTYLLTRPRTTADSHDLARSIFFEVWSVIQTFLKEKGKLTLKEMTKDDYYEAHGYQTAYMQGKTNVGLPSTNCSTALIVAWITTTQVNVRGRRVVNKIRIVATWYVFNVASWAQEKPVSYVEGKCTK